jgi:3-dehydroquinate synthetase
LKCKWTVKHIGINHTFGFAILEVEGKEGHQIYGWVNRLYKEVHTHIKITKETESQLLKYILHDKKNIGDNLCFALPKGIGAYELYCGVSLDEIKKVISNY